MGLSINSLRFLLGEKERGLSIGNLLTLGRQEVYVNGDAYGTILNSLGRKRTVPTYGDDFLFGIGASTLQVMDASDYEGAQVIHDLNEPPRRELSEAFDTVIDGGTLEHVFNFPTAIKTCMEMVRPGGHLILMTPWHNYAGHGFYQFSPELFYGILSPANGYVLKRMFIVSGGYWYTVRDPSKTKRRIEVSSSDSIDLFIVAERTDSKEVFQTWPQQSDYSTVWENQSYDNNEKISSLGFRESLVKKLKPLQIMQCKWRIFKSRRVHSPSRNPGMVKICKSSEIPS